MAFIFYRKTGWVLIDKRERVWMKLGKISKAEAKAVLLRYETDRNYLRLDLPLAAHRITLRRLCDAYIEDIRGAKGAYTVDREEKLLEHFCRQAFGEKTFGDALINELTGRDLEKYLAAKGYKAYSAHNVAKALRGAYKFAVERRYLSHNPILDARLPKVEKLPPRAADPKAVEKILAELSGAAKQFYLILAYSGMRPGEAVALQVRDVTKEGLIIRSNKTKTFRVVPIHPRLRLTLGLLKKGRGPHDYLFPNGSGGHVLSFKKSFREAAKRAKVKGTFPYALRHFFATQVLKNTGDLRAVQTLLGHSRSTTTERYAHSLGETLKKAVRSLGK